MDGLNSLATRREIKPSKFFQKITAMFFALALVTTAVLLPSPVSASGLETATVTLIPSATSTPSSTRTSTPTVTPTPSRTATAIATVRSTATSSPTVEKTKTLTPVPTIAPTDTPTLEPTADWNPTAWAQTWTPWDVGTPLANFVTPTPLGLVTYATWTVTPQRVAKLASTPIVRLVNTTPPVLKSQNLPTRMSAVSNNPATPSNSLALAKTVPDPKSPSGSSSIEILTLPTVTFTQDLVDPQAETANQAETSVNDPMLFRVGALALSGVLLMGLGVIGVGVVFFIDRLLR